jgi:hypothetical protein
MDGLLQSPKRALSTLVLEDEFMSSLSLARPVSYLGSDCAELRMGKAVCDP